MGNGSSGLPVDLGSKIECNNLVWELNEGSRRRLDGSGNEVFEDILVLRSKAQGTNNILLEAANRGIQKLRIMKHPSILAFVDSKEVDSGVVMMATEAAIPLSKWINDALSNKNSKDEITQEVVWGFHCIVEALQFIHRQCKLLHGNISPEAIFITKTGDWKLGAFELASDVNVDEAYFSRALQLIPKNSASPELKSGQWRQLFTSTLYGPLDIYGLGTTFRYIFEELQLASPPQLSQYIKKMEAAEPKKRPTTAQLLRCPIFSSDLYKGMQAIQELRVKTPDECIETLERLSTSHTELSPTICTFKVLPVLNRLLQAYAVDFNNRNSREAVRKNIVICLCCVSNFAESNKLQPCEFEKTAIPVLINIWAISDRTIRTSLLKSLKSTATLYPSEVVNKSILDHLFVGFTDANAILREETLKSLIHLIDKLDENMVNDKVPRSVTTLQNDGEPSIRTNTVIFLGRLIPRLKETVGVRIMCTCLLKAMKDNFAPCRLAGLKALNSALHLLDCGNLTGKVLPLVVSMTMDRSHDVRELSLRIIDAAMLRLREQHKVLATQEAKARSLASPKKASIDSLDSSAQSEGSGSGSVFSWAVSAMSKSLENAADSTTPQDGSKSERSDSVGPTSSMSGLSLSSPVRHASAAALSQSPSLIGGPSLRPASHGTSTASLVGGSSHSGSLVGVQKSCATSSSAWDEDDFDDDNDDFDVSDGNGGGDAVVNSNAGKLNVVAPKKAQSSERSAATSAPERPRPARAIQASSSPKKGMSVSKPKKPVVAKLAKTDDDDDWDF